MVIDLSLFSSFRKYFHVDVFLEPAVINVIKIVSMILD